MAVIAVSPPTLKTTCSGCGWVLQHTREDLIVHVEDDEITHGARPSHVRCPRCKTCTEANDPYAHR